jgi:hypothetical protein
VTAAPDPTLFTESLVIDLALPGKLGDARVPGGNVKGLSLELAPYGFRGQVTFWMPADEGKDVHARVTDGELLTFELKISKRHYLEETPAPLALAGVVTARSFVEVAAADVVGRPVLFRRYTLSLEDAACALWSRHHPTDVYARTSLEKVIAEHTPAPIAVKAGWGALKTKRPIVCLALGDDEASFYDFVCWFTDEQQGHFSYDYGKALFRFTDRKAQALTSETLTAELCAQARVHLAEAPRVAVEVINSHAHGTARTAVANTLAVDGLVRDVHLHSPLAQDSKDRETLEKRRLRAGQAELEILCRSWPEIYLAPGVCAKLDSDEWSGHLHHAGKTLRTIGVRLEAVASDDSPEHDLGLPFTDHGVRLSYRFEVDDDPRPRLPAYRRPRYPLRVEGKVLSTLGDQGDRAYMIYEDQQTSRDHYQVLLPLWNATIDVPFQPGFSPGHLYFPAYKDSRVMLALDFDASRIENFLDWGSGVRVPATSQGNHILFGKNDSSETSLRHWYVDAKPELQIRRVHNGDTGVLTVKDGLLTLETFDDSAGGGLGLPTVSLKAEAEGSKAQAQGQTELAASDLESAVQSMGGQLGGDVESASASVRGQATSLEGDVRGRAEAASSALESIGGDAQAAGSQASETVSDARRKIKGLFEGE